MKERIGVGFLGAGVVGGGALEVLFGKSDALTRSVGAEMVVKRVLVRDPKKARAVDIPEELLTKNASDILDDPSIQVVVELIGGENPAREYISRALKAGKHVVTANKEVIAKHGPELLRLASENHANLFFEAAVGGGIPIIETLRRELLANEMRSIQAIINGTTNYILTDMATGRDYAEALAEAQRLGYAESDPRNDVEAHDAAYKLSILATLAFRTPVHPDSIVRVGITKLAARDFRYAAEMGYVIKLIAWARASSDESHKGQVEGAVYPMLIPTDHHLAAVRGVFNAILLDGDQIDQLMLYGRGAGARPTASAVVADICRCAHNLIRDVIDQSPITQDARPIRPFGELSSRFYFRMEVVDQPGVLSMISRVLGEKSISIASFIQKERGLPGSKGPNGDGDLRQGAEIVIMTHTATESQVAEALDEIKKLQVVREIRSFIRVDPNRDAAPVGGAS